MLALWLSLRVGCRFLAWRWRLRLRPSRLMESTSSGMKQTLLFIRHGETAWNVEHRLPGQLPGISLNEKGIQQVTLLAEALAIFPISALISSPLERACETRKSWRGDAIAHFHRT